MVEWNDEAVEAACSILWKLWEHRINNDHMRAALDTAVDVQFQPNTASIAYQMAYESGRAEAFEETAAYFGRIVGEHDWISTAIRKLAKESAE